ncbi:GMC family oxidoreductase N-terminal domain-containing protein [Rhodoluna lacicola]|uniref:GMC family oxidoreductase N-terminal domain-containing protein n=1 Tax=Rhodoluna lacicola TaxID=529884 RepID=UPI00222E84CD|nr:GMC family oxidoreductase [Rhodoluna lacicola]BDS49985.1 cholesterol oxidase [Rhodoluna lacicola]
MTVGFDVAVIGSGFGGSVAALRLTEKGYRVLVIEAGARFEDHQFAKNSFDLKRFLFFPKLGMLGIQRIDFLRNVLVMSGAGVGGGSLVYANTLYRPPNDFFNTGSWAQIADWQSLLNPYYDIAERMLGVQVNPFFSPADLVLKKVAKDRGVENTFQMAPLGIYFGEAGNEVRDPYFDGNGPRRTGCINCGECMTGCRHGAKNTLVKNYLYLAENAGAEVWDLTTVSHIQKLTDGGFELKLRRTLLAGKSRPQSIHVPQVIVAAGALGSAKLLQKSRDRGGLPGISKKLGELSRTNSESLLGVVAKKNDHDFTAGSAITSSVFPDAHTHIEPVRYGKGSGFMGLLQSVLASGGNGESPNFARLLKATFKNVLRLPNFYNLRTWPERTLILLVMQSRDNSLTTYLKRSKFFTKKLTSRQGYGEVNPSWVPVGHEFARDIAAEINGTPGAVVGEPFGIPLTAHFLGGAVIGADENSGVVDPYLRVFGVPGLHIWDGSTLSANPGVNPSLSIAAQAEWAAAHWPNRGEADARTPLGFKFGFVQPTQARWPVLKRAPRVHGSRFQDPSSTQPQ